MAQPWYPSDRRQQEIHQRLRLVGGEPAAFFLDACRIMEFGGDSLGLLSTTHLVGHLLREIENGVADVLAPLSTSSPAPGGDNAHAKRIAVLCTVLGVQDENFKRLWRTYAVKLAGLAHRHARDAPRPVSSEFLEVWSQAQAVLEHLTSRIEANYTLALPAADALAASPPDVAAFQQRLLHSPGVLDRFFERAGPEWLEPLRQAGVFASPAALTPREDGTVAFVRWPPGPFLIRCASEAPETVLQIALELDTDNPEAHESLVDAALEMGADLAAQLVPQVEMWLGTSAQWQLPFKARDLGIHLAAGGRIAEGLSLIRTLVVSLGFQRGSQLGAEVVRQVADQMFPQAGGAGIDTLADLLVEALEAEQSGGQDYSYVWRSSLAVEVRRDVRDALISALRDGADAVIAAEPGSLDAVLVSLDARPLPIFRRLALHLLLRAPNIATAAERLCDRRHLDDPNTEGEYAELLVARFSELDAEAQRIILGHIDVGPEGDPGDGDLAERWRLQWLSRLPRPLPGPWGERFEGLVGRFGEPQHGAAAGPRVTRARWSESPVSLEELEAMAMPDVVSYLRSWAPAGDGRAGPSRAGLESQLRQAVTQRPGDFADASEEFLGLSPDYARALVSGLEEARRQGQTFAWEAVLRFSATALEKPRGPGGRLTQEVGAGDEGWRSVWQRIAHLICDGLGGESRIPPEERARVWGVISRLSCDENPTPEDELDRDMSALGPATLALNSIRGVAIRAAMAYVWWLHDVNAGESATMPPEARELLDRHLDPAFEPSAAIRSVYGWFFPYLATADPRWAEENVQRIFPEEPDNLWRAAWHSYVGFNGLWETPFHRGSAVDGHTIAGKRPVSRGNRREAPRRRVSTPSGAPRMAAAPTRARAR